MAGDANSRTDSSQDFPDQRLASAVPLDGDALRGRLPAISADRRRSSKTLRAVRRSPGAAVRWAIRVSIAVAFVMSGSRAVSAQVPGVGHSVCDRTYQVSDAIVTASGVANCSYVTLHQLREITALDLSYQGILNLSAGDFDGLVRLDTLDLSGNALTTLPQGVFDELLLLRSLRLDGNQLRSLPVHVFDELFMLEELTLYANPLLRMASPAFSGLVRFAATQDDADLPPWGVDAGSLDRFLDGVNTVEQFIGALPALYKERFSLVYASESPARESVSRNYPRVVSWGGDGTFIFSWNTDPGAPAQFRRVVEFLRRGKTSWSAGMIDFSGTEPAVTEPALCQTCHGPLNKPLWGGYGFWEGTDFSQSPSELEASRRAMESTDPRLAPLDFSMSYLLHGQRYLTVPGCGYGHCLGIGEESSSIMAWRHAEVLLQQLKTRDDFRGWAEEAMCAGDTTAVQTAALAPFDRKDHNPAVLADSGGIIQGGPEWAFTIHPDYHYGVGGSLGGALSFLILVELWDDEPIVRKLYREVSNTDSAIGANDIREKLLYYERGSASAEDELIAKLRIHFGAATRESIDDRTQRGVEISYFEMGHLRRMVPRVCSALRNTKPTDLEVALRDGEAELSWTAPRQTDGPDGYRVLRGVDGEEPGIHVENTASTNMTWTDSGLAAGDYVWIVQALYDDYPSPRSNAVRGTVADEPEGPPLTASFHQMPASHNGASPFAFELRFSEEVPISFVALRDTAFQVTNGQVAEARRLNTGSNLRWAITVGPTSLEDITIVLPGGRSCDSAGAICTSDERPLTGSVQATVEATEESNTALTASFHGVPPEHDAETTFTFELRFSEEVGVSYVTLRDSAFTVTNGQVTGARRLNRPSNVRWEITVAPSSSGDITVILPGGRSCNVAGAICTAGGKQLSNSPSATVR